MRIDNEIRQQLETYAERSHRTLSSAINHLLDIAMKGDLDAVKAVHSSLAGASFAVEAFPGKETAEDPAGTGNREGIAGGGSK